MKRLLLLAILLCSVVGFGKDKLSYDHKASISVQAGIHYKDAPYTVTVEGQTIACITTDTNIDCGNQTAFVYDTLYIFDFHGQSGRFSHRLTSGKLDSNFVSHGCDPLNDLVLKLISKNGSAAFEYRYGKHDNEILVPCTTVDKKGNIKTQEAHYEILLY